MFYVFYPLLWILSLLPLKVLYLLSDILLYPLAYYIVRYRRKVVRQNLINSFPDYDLKKIKGIERKFYHFFCDLIIEIVYNISASPKNIKKRMLVTNPEVFTKHYADKQSIMLMSGHYGNWEWATAIGLHFPENYTAFSIYKQLTNKQVDRFMIKIRNRFGGECVEKDQVLRKIFTNQQEDKHGAFAMISDQTPRWANIRHWVKFLNQDTSVFIGTERIAKKYNFPVYYGDIQRVKRGYYEVTFTPISLNPKETAENEITDTFMSILEERIIAKPEFWLWSHRRWKHQRSTEN